MRNSLIEKIYTKKSIQKIKNKTKLLGIHNNLNPISFLNIRVVICLVLFFSLLFLLDYGYLYAPIITIVFYFLFEYIMFDYRIKKRARQLDYDGLFFFEVLTLSLETGRNLKKALDLTCKNINNELSDEFNEALRQMKYSKTLPEALEDMKERIPSDTINNVILNIIQSNVFGNSILETLYRQVDYLRDKKVLDVRGIIAKMPNKISAISVIFFIPIILIMILGPVIINYFS